MEDRPDNLRNRVFCSSCGTAGIRRHGLAPFGWQEFPGPGGRQQALCPSCVRQNLFLIEARLDFDPELGG